LAVGQPADLVSFRWEPELPGPEIAGVWSRGARMG
jgi:hypothetical protein